MEDGINLGGNSKSIGSIFGGDLNKSCPSRSQRVTTAKTNHEGSQSKCAPKKMCLSFT